MDQIALQEKEKYDSLWRELPDYRIFSPADLLTPAFLMYFEKEIQKGDSVLDFGCGSGRSATPLLKAGLQVHLVDLCDDCLDPAIFLQTVGSNPSVHFYQECLWDLSDNVKPAEWMICFDVLEHLPEEKLESVLKHMASRMQKGGLISIYLLEDNFGVLIGEILHLTQRPATWWQEALNRHFHILQEWADEEKTILALKKK